MTTAIVQITGSGDTAEVVLEEISSTIVAVDAQYAIPSSGGIATGQVRFIPDTDLPASTSAGGAVNVFNSASEGAGVVVYSTNAAPTGHLIVGRAASATFNQAAFYADYEGTSHSVSVNHKGTGLASSAANLASSNTEHSALQVSGVEDARGTVKVTHTGTGSDANAAALSLQLAGSGTAAQGVYIYSDDGTTGDLIEANNAGALQFRVASDGDTELVGDLILRSPNGTRWAIRVDNSGNLSTTSL